MAAAPKTKGVLTATVCVAITLAATGHAATLPETGTVDIAAKSDDAPVDESWPTGGVRSFSPALRPSIRYSRISQTAALASFWKAKRRVPWIHSITFASSTGLVRLHMTILLTGK